MEMRLVLVKCLCTGPLIGKTTLSVCDRKRASRPPSVRTKNGIKAVKEKNRGSPVRMQKISSQEMRIASTTILRPCRNLKAIGW